MNINFTNVRNNLIIHLNGDLDHHAVIFLKEKIDREYSRVHAKHIVFDFTNVSFMDSSGIGLVLARYKNLEGKGGRVKVYGLSGDLLRIFNVSGLQKVIKAYDTEKDAVVNE